MTARKPRLLAVIELGTTSIRMVVGQASGTRRVETIDALEQAVSLGRDTLTRGVIGRETTERCVNALCGFRRVFEEYGVGERDVRVVATSAVREAANRDSFLDRVLVATGLNVEVIDQAEVNRLTYRAVQPQLRAQPFFRKSDVLVVEVGGGSTETLLFRKGKVSAAHLYRLGALRLRTLFEDENAPRQRLESLMRAEITQTLAQMHHNLGPLFSPQMVLLGSEARFACSALSPGGRPGSPCELTVPAFRKFVRRIIGKTVDQVAREYSLSYTEAETLGPSLFICTALAEELKLKRVLVGEATLRTGILAEMTTGERWTAEFRRQVINSAMAIARRYDVDLRHARHVAAYGRQIIDALRDRYDLSERDEVIFHVAALLHEVGQAINASGHHKHSRYLILNSDIFGLGRRDITLAALVARYHRRAAPRPSHADYMELGRADRITVSKLSAIMRVANALDRLHSPRPLKLKMRLEGKRFVMEALTDSDLSLLQRRVQERSQLFTSIFGKEVLLRSKGK